MKQNKLRTIKAARSLRKKMTPAETLLWKYLSNKGVCGAKFRRQHPVRGFVIDFYCPQSKLGLEIDGEVHDKQKDYDEARQLVLESEGIEVLRFQNSEVMENIESVLRSIKDHLPSTAPLHSMERGLRGEDLKSELSGFKKLSIIGVGSEIRGDDRIGLYVAEKLKREVRGKRYEVLMGGTTPENLTGALRKSKPTHVILIDAASSGKSAGAVSIIDPKQISGVSFSTHSFSLETLADYLKQTIGAKTIIIGIEPKNLGLTEEMSDEVLKAGDEVVKLLLDIPRP